MRFTGRIGYSSKARPNDRVWRTADSVSRCARRTRRRNAERVAQRALKLLDEPGDPGSWAAHHDVLDRDGTVLRRVVVHRRPDLVGEAAGPVRQAFPCGTDVFGVAFDRLLGLHETDVDEPLPGVLDGQAAPLGELLGDALHAEGGEAGEQARTPASDGKVGDVAQVAVELGRREVLV